MKALRKGLYLVIGMILVLMAVAPAAAEGPDVGTKIPEDAEVGMVEVEVTPGNGIEWGPGCSAWSGISYIDISASYGWVKGSSSGRCSQAIQHMSVQGRLYIGGGLSWSGSSGGYLRKSVSAKSGWKHVSNRPQRIQEKGSHQFEDPQYGSWNPPTAVSMSY